MPIPGLTIIGDRINPGFRPTRKLVDARDYAGLQALAIRQVEAGAIALDVNPGPAGMEDHDFLPEIVRQLQAATDTPLCLDHPDPRVIAPALEAYDPAKAGGRKPIINSVAASRWAMKDVVRLRPCKVIVMSAERLVAGVVTACQSGGEVHASAREMIDIIQSENPHMTNDDFFVDVSVSTLAADMEGRTRMALDAIRLVHSDPDLAGVHIVGGLTNLPQHLPAKAADGSELRHQLECAFLTVATPLGFDTVLGTPWPGYDLLPEDNFVLKTFREIISLEGYDALMAVTKLYDRG